MAPRHFDTEGYPKLDLIASEIRSFFSDFGSIAGPLAEHVRAKYPFNLSAQLYGGWNQEQLLSMVLQSGTPVLPDGVTVSDVFAVGSQGRLLPDTYACGEHDLDLLLVSNLERVADSEAAAKTMELLRYALNGPERTSREHMLDLSVAEAVPADWASYRLPEGRCPVDTSAFIYL